MVFHLANCVVLPLSKTVEGVHLSMNDVNRLAKTEAVEARHAKRGWALHATVASVDFSEGRLAETCLSLQQLRSSQNKSSDE